MAQEIGESRDAWGQDVWDKAQDFANNTKSDKPFYIVYAAKAERSRPNVFRQTFKAYHQRPPAILGILVWYVNHPLGEFRFLPELSSPPDIPLDPSLLSNQASDASERVMDQGKKMNILVS
jgi:hypothetical protein